MAKKDRYQISLKFFLRNGDGKLLAMAQDRGSFAGLFDIPGGRIETDEFATPFADIIRREAKEELGGVEFELGDAPVAVGRHLIPASVNEKNEQILEIHVLYLFFEARLISGDIRVSEEHSGYQWLDSEQVRKTPERYFKSGNLEGVRMYLSQRPK